MTARNRRDMVLDASALLVSKSAFIALRLSVLYLYARQVDSATFGPIALAMTAAEICRFVGDWGCDTLSLRKFSVPRLVDAERILRWVLVLRIPSSLIAFLTALIGIRCLAGVTDPLTMALIAATAVSSLWLNTTVNWLQARQELRSFAPAIAGLGFLSVAAQILIADQGGSLPTKLGALLAGECAMIFAGMTRLPANPLAKVSRPTLTDLRQWLHESTPIAIAALLAMTYTRFDQFYLGRTGSGELLGSYTLAVRLVEPLFFVAAAMSSTLYVRASGIVHSHGAAAVSAIAFKWVLVTAGSTAVVAGIMATVGSWLIPHFLPSYDHADIFLGIALLGLIFRASNLCLTAFLQALGHYHLMMKISILNLVLVPMFVLSGDALMGALGVGLGMALADATNTGVQIFKLRQATRESPMRAA